MLLPVAVTTVIRDFGAKNAPSTAVSDVEMDFVTWNQENVTSVLKHYGEITAKSSASQTVAVVTEITANVSSAFLVDTGTTV